ncbi:MAG: nicotinate-nucleotide adenylyltransferase [Lachnospiraceae bacterium]|nr:nicotinate-nucleotide adenylyltransferase [Lachnospiraceae bacterium]
MKIGILGGTFDPIHKAHLKLGHEACRAFALDHVWVMPTGNSYLKTEVGTVTDAEHRAEMVRLAIQDDPLLEFSDIELRRPGYTYTADTLLSLTKEYPEVEWHFIIGADSLHGMEHWVAPEVIFRCASVIVANRNRQVDDEVLLRDKKHLEERFGARILPLNFESMDVSSSQIRRDIAEGHLPHPALTDEVNRYIQVHELYAPHLEEEQICQWLQQRLKPSRYRHTLGVADTAEKLARHYGTVDARRARLAGLLHDCGKNEGTALTHGPIGAEIAREELGIRDEELLNAIRYHTTGRPAMTDLEKIIFIADYIEPNRDRAPHLKELRRMAYIDLNETIRCILKDTLAYLRDSKTVIDERSLETYNYYNATRKGSIHP